MSTKNQPVEGSNSGETVFDGDASEQMILFCERWERLEEEKKAMSDDQKDVMLEAKSQGYDPKHLRYVIRMRKMEKTAREEEWALQETYLRAAGLL